MSFFNPEKNQQLAKFLKEQRIKQNLTIEDVSAKTGVPSQHLKSVEEAHFEKFDMFYLKMYIKKYASVLNLNIDELTEQYSDVKVSVAKPVVKQKKVKAKTRKSPIAPKKVFVALAAIIIVAGIGYASTVIEFDFMQAEDSPIISHPNSENVLDSTPETDSEDTEEAVNAEADDSQSDEEELSIFTNVSFDSTEGDVSTYLIQTSDEGYKLQMTFTADCWLDIKLDSQSIITPAVYSVDDLVEVEISAEMLEKTQEIILNIGNVNATNITINDEVVEAPSTTPHQYLALMLGFE